MKKQKGFTLIELLIVIVIIGIIAAIAIPGLLRARVNANESAAIGDTRTLISAQATYAAANGGLYDQKLSCLSTPATGCIPNYGANAPTFLDASWSPLTRTKSGYVRTFQSIAAAGGSIASPTSASQFTLGSTPLVLNRTGTRSFCGDDSGVICGSQNTTTAPCSGGSSVLAGCTPVQ